MTNFLSRGKCNYTLPFSVSITLKARWFKASSSSKVGLLERCDNVTKTVDVDPYSVCSGRVSGKYQYDQKYMSGLCAIKSKFLSQDFGISVYDIDADMEDKSCATVEYPGQYKRLKLLKRIQQFLKGYTATNMQKACENL
ncbi:hypothetical protein MTO96_028901 [Rhipicephalus appendiculatus]